MVDHLNEVRDNAWALLILLLVQSIVYWTAAIYLGVSAVPVAYQQF